MINEAPPKFVWCSQGAPIWYAIWCEHWCSVRSVLGESKPQAFEVASVKPHQGTLTRIADLRASGPRLSLEDYSAYYLILEAYKLRSYQLSLASPICRQATTTTSRRRRTGIIFPPETSSGIRLKHYWRVDSN